MKMWESREKLFVKSRWPTWCHKKSRFLGFSHQEREAENKISSKESKNKTKHQALAVALWPHIHLQNTLVDRGVNYRKVLWGRGTSKPLLLLMVDMRCFCRNIVFAFGWTWVFMSNISSLGPDIVICSGAVMWTSVTHFYPDNPSNKLCFFSLFLNSPSWTLTSSADEKQNLAAT